MVVVRRRILTFFFASPILALGVTSDICNGVEFTLTLRRHPATPAPVVRTDRSARRALCRWRLALAYCLRGDMARLRIPAPQTPGSADGLWEHTCFEAFVGVAGETAYHEFNFSPSGEWAAYAFSGYRQRDTTRALCTPPQITATLSAGRLELEAVLAAAVPATDFRRGDAADRLSPPSSKPPTPSTAATATGRLHTPGQACRIFTIVTVLPSNWRHRASA
jgi:hypothetical protein